MHVKSVIGTPTSPVPAQVLVFLELSLAHFVQRSVKASSRDRPKLKVLAGLVELDFMYID